MQPAEQIIPIHTHTIKKTPSIAGGVFVLMYHCGDEVTTFSEFLFLFLFFVFYKKVSEKTFTLFTTASLTEKLFTKSSPNVHILADSAATRPEGRRALDNGQQGIPCSGYVMWVRRHGIPLAHNTNIMYECSNIWLLYFACPL